MKDMGKVKKSKSFTKDPNSKASHLSLSLSSRAMATIVLSPRSNEIVIFHPFVGFWEARDKPDDGQPGLEVKPFVGL